MTSNQIAYWAKEESVRSNKAREAEAHRANVEQESLKFQDIRENIRHNQAEELLKQVNNDLTKEGLRIKNTESLLKYLDLASKYGVNLYNIPDDQSKKIMNELFQTSDSHDYSYKAKDIGQAFGMAGDKIADWWSKIFGSIGKALF